MYTSCDRTKDRSPRLASLRYYYSLIFICIHIYYINIITVNVKVFYNYYYHYVYCAVQAMRTPRSLFTYTCILAVYIRTRECPVEIYKYSEQWGQTTRKLR